MVDGDTGEIIANDELTEALLKKLRAAGVKEIQCLYTNELDEGAYISQTLASDETADRVRCPRRHLPHDDAPRRAADGRRRRGPVQPLVLQHRHLRPEPCRPHEVQCACRP